MSVDQGVSKKTRVYASNETPPLLSVMKHGFNSILTWSNSVIQLLHLYQSLGNMANSASYAAYGAHLSNECNAVLHGYNSNVVGVIDYMTQIAESESISSHYSTMDTTTVSARATDQAASHNNMMNSLQHVASSNPNYTMGAAVQSGGSAVAPSHDVYQQPQPQQQIQQHGQQREQEKQEQQVGGVEKWFRRRELG